MSNTIYQPYTYLIGWSKQKKYYYGVKYGESANPKTFWVDYYTSSKHIPLLRESFGEPDIIQIRKTFKSKEDAIKWETKVLRRINAAGKEYFINETNGNLNWYNKGGYKCTQEHIDNMINSRWTEEKKKKHSIYTTQLNKEIWSKRSTEEKNKILSKISESNKGKEPWNRNTPHTNETIKKISKNTKNAMKSTELRSHLSQKAKARCDEKFSKRISENNKRKVSCVFCKREVNLSNLGRHQKGSKCKKD